MEGYVKTVATATTARPFRRTAAEFWAAVGLVAEVAGLSDEALVEQLESLADLPAPLEDAARERRRLVAIEAGRRLIQRRRR